MLLTYRQPWCWALRDTVEGIIVAQAATQAELRIAKRRNEELYSLHDMTYDFVIEPVYKDDDLPGGYHATDWPPE